MPSYLVVAIPPQAEEAISTFVAFCFLWDPIDCFVVRITEDSDSAEPFGRELRAERLVAGSQ